MRMLWKVLLVCLVTLPVGVYVASAMRASTADAPDRREPIVIEQPAPSSGSPDGLAPSARPTSDPTDDDPDESDDPNDEDDDDRVDTVHPSPDDVDDREGDERDRGGDDD